MIPRWGVEVPNCCSDFVRYRWATLATQPNNQGPAKQKRKQQALLSQSASSASRSCRTSDVSMQAPACHILASLTRCGTAANVYHIRITRRRSVRFRLSEGVREFFAMHAASQNNQANTCSARLSWKPAAGLPERNSQIVPKLWVPRSQTAWSYPQIESPSVFARPALMKAPNLDVLQDCEKISHFTDNYLLPNMA